MIKTLHTIQKITFFLSMGYLIICHWGLIILFLFPLPLGNRENMDQYLPFMLRNLPWAIITTITGTIQLYSSFGEKYTAVMLASSTALGFYLLIQYKKKHLLTVIKTTL